jgi:hypothetical protein
MSGCQSVHEHPEFKESFDSSSKTHNIEVTKLKRFLKADPGYSIGEYLKGDLVPFKSFPRGHKDVRVLFILCKDCKKEAIKPNCNFCGSQFHHMDDAVLFYVADHDKAYKKGKQVIEKYLS